jgi:hypothetical protein
MTSHHTAQNPPVLFRSGYLSDLLSELFAIDTRRPNPAPIPRDR